MFKKFLNLFLIITVAICLCACVKPRTTILFNNAPITKENLLKNATQFIVGKPIYYIFIAEKPIDTQYVRMKVLKRDDKANYAVTKVAYSNDFRLNKDQIYYYTDYIVLHEAGYYCMVVYGRDALDKPLAKADFRVKN